MKKLVQIGFFAIIITLCVLLVLRFKSSYKELEKETQILSSNINEINYRNRKLNNIYLNSINIIPKDILNDLAGVRKKKTIIGFFNEHNCGYCVKEVIIELEKFRSQYENANIYLISNVEREEDFFKPFGGKKQDDFPYFYVKNDNTLAEVYGSYPVILVVNTSGEILHIYVPDLQKDYNEVYFNEILPEILFDNI